MPVPPRSSRAVPVPTPPRAFRAQAEAGPSPLGAGSGRSAETVSGAIDSPESVDSLPVTEETSAGGLVIDFTASAPHVAVIARRNRAGRLEWCLPKGHLEGDETEEEAAIREIAEETGIDGRILLKVGMIDYWFTGRQSRIHKSVHHFVLEAIGGELTVENDPDREAEDVQWIALADLPERLAYPNERRLVVLATQMLQERE